VVDDTFPALSRTLIVILFRPGRSGTAAIHVSVPVANPVRPRSVIHSTLPTLRSSAALPARVMTGLSVVVVGIFARDQGVVRAPCTVTGVEGLALDADPCGAVVVVAVAFADFAALAASATPFQPLGLDAGAAPDPLAVATGAAAASDFLPNTDRAMLRAFCCCGGAGAAAGAAGASGVGCGAVGWGAEMVGPAFGCGGAGVVGDAGVFTAVSVFGDDDPLPGLTTVPEFGSATDTAGALSWGGATTVHVKVSASLSEPSVTDATTTNEPVAVGTPAILPALLMDRPGGSPEAP
jgi:hypothetical protein